jgi:glyoxylase-like metal-dependent hydrolase (beta-lactamase superfamily II)
MLTSRNRKLRGGYQTCPTKPTRPLQPGDHIGSLRAVAALGHTPGQLAFYDERDGALIVGDAFQTRGGVAISGTVRPFFPLPVLATWDKSTALATAHAPGALAPTLLTVGHGPALLDPLQAMDLAIAEAEHRLGGKVTYGH